MQRPGSLAWLSGLSLVPSGLSVIPGGICSYVTIPITTLYSLRRALAACVQCLWGSHGLEGWSLEDTEL